MRECPDPSAPTHPTRRHEILYIVDPIHPDGIDRLRQRFDVILPGDHPDERRLAEVSVVVVRTSKAFDAWLARLPKLKLIAKHGSGIDNIDVPAATRRGILVANTPGGSNSTSVAEGAVALMLAVLRRVCEMDRLVREGRFNQRWSLELGDLTGASLGLVGFGQIAKVVSRICVAGFGMEVAAYDPFVPEPGMREMSVKKVDALLDLMTRDVVSVHVPLSDKTHHLIGEPELAAMQPSAILVNTSRGGLVDEAALARALRTGRIRGAGLDVLEQEPPLPDNPLFKLPNVVLSPHVAGVTNASLRGMALAVADVVETAMSGRKPATLINPEALEHRCT